jgi:hypothetical protein
MSVLSISFFRAGPFPGLFSGWLPSFFAAGVFAWTLSSSPAAARSDGCPDFGPVEVRVELQLAPIRRDDGRALAELARLPGRRPGPANSSRAHVLGLTLAQYGDRSQIGTAYQQVGPRAFCAGAKSLEVTFGFQERTVLVASELPRNSCIHREVLAHEMKHIAVDEKLLREFGPTIRRRLEAVAARAGSVRASTQQQALAAARRPFDMEMRALFREFGQKRDRLQAQVDSSEEYERVSRSCGGEVAKYIPQGRRL